MKKKNRNQKNKFMTYDKNAVFFKSTVLEILEQTECSNGRFKTVFKVRFPQGTEPKTCILWERSCMEVGDKIDLKGIFKDNIFIAYSAMVTKKNGNI